MKFYKIKKIKIKDIVGPECISWDDEQIAMIENIVQNYGINDKLIKITSDKKIIDGNHRYCILYEEFGEEHEIVVKQLPVKRGLYFILLSLSLPILLPLGLIIKTINKIKNNE